MKNFDPWNMYADDLYNEYGKDGKKVFVVMDCKDGKLYSMSKQSTNPRMANLGSFKLEGSWYFPVRTQLKNAIGFCCKSTALRKYGKKVVDYTPVFSETDNPNFKCACPMKIYARPMLEYVARELSNILN